MSEEILKVFLTDLRTVRIACQQCNAIVELDIQNIRARIHQPACPVCGAEFIVPGSVPAMPRFVQVGNHWINLELVAGIELVEESTQPGAYTVARVHYVSGKTQDFQVAADIKVLVTFLKNHKAS